MMAGIGTMGMGMGMRMGMGMGRVCQTVTPIAS